jgi:hypothetical protein
MSRKIDRLYDKYVTIHLVLKDAQRSRFGRCQFGIGTAAFGFVHRCPPRNVVIPATRRGPAPAFARARNERFERPLPATQGRRQPSPHHRRNGRGRHASRASLDRTLGVPVGAPRLGSLLRLRSPVPFVGLRLQEFACPGREVRGVRVKGTRRSVTYHGPWGHSPAVLRPG